MRVLDSQAYRKMDVTRGRISRILELREMLLSFQTAFNLVHALSLNYVRIKTLVRYLDRGIAARLQATPFFLTSFRSNHFFILCRVVECTIT